MTSPEPRKPSNVPPLVEACLQAIVASGAGAAISLGGAFALAHYHEYRETHDVDAWWVEPVESQSRDRLLAAVEAALAPHGEVRRRQFGDVTSIESLRFRKKVFSFQIARRSALLEPLRSAPWEPIRLDGFHDLVASKMAALVERGAPRDFRDIFTLCTRGLITPFACWTLWRRRQESAGEDTAALRARTAIGTHLSRIQAARPLDSIDDPGERERAAATRRWFETELANALVD